MVASLYFHLPFCRKKCPYCHFYVLPDREELKDQLLESLRLEWGMRRPQLEGEQIASVYFGGGTPALFGPERIGEVLSWIEPGDVEITLEANPEDVTVELIGAYRDAGINRISLGIQSLDDELLKRIGRTHSAAQAIESVHATHAAGISNITIDLMLELPGQGLDQVERTLDTVVELPITHLSLYNLTLEPPSLFYRDRDSIAPRMPSEEIGLQMLEMACNRLEGASLARYEISAFARPGFEAEHNRGYWTGRPFLGLGPSAFSYWEGQRFRNVAHQGKYSRALAAGEEPVDYREEMTPAERTRELFAVGLRLTEGATLPPDVAIDSLIEQGLVERVLDRVRLTERGRLFYDSVASEII